MITSIQGRQFERAQALPELEGKKELLAALVEGASRKTLHLAIDRFRASNEVDENVARQIAIIRLEARKHIFCDSETLHLKDENPELFEEMLDFLDEGDFSLEAMREFIGARDPKDFLYSSKAIKDCEFFYGVCELLEAPPEVVEGLCMVRETIGFRKWRTHWNVFGFTDGREELCPYPFDRLTTLAPMWEFFGVKSLIIRYSCDTYTCEAIAYRCEQSCIKRICISDRVYSRENGYFRVL